VQLEVDTGMRRTGAPLEAAAAIAAAIAAEPALELTGVFTHLACADEPDLAPSRAQLAAFRRWLDAALPASGPGLLVHAANSAALLVGETLAVELPRANAVRPGVLLYGVSPFGPPAEAAAPLRPVMRLSTSVIDVRDVGAGDAVGYRATYHAPGPTRIATLAIGYADGVPWTLANRGEVLLHGRRRPLVGRVSMDLVTVDAGDLAVSRGDEAVLIGAQGSERISAEEMAAAAGTLGYEIVTRVGPRVPRRWHDAGDAV
jgi:alanine racemase